MIKSFTGKAGVEEQQFLQQWLAGAEENRKEFEVYRKLWNDSKSLMLSPEVDVEAALRATKNRIPRLKTKTFRIIWLRMAAAVVLLSIFLSVTLNYFLDRSANKAGQPVYQEIKAACGTQSRLTLSDGTEVWLNSGSSLRFPISFAQAGRRCVELCGEGYFEVTENAQRPFVVKIGSFHIRVLGTSFNVNAYDQDKQVEVALLEGRVELRKQMKGQEKTVLRMEPSEVAVFHAETNRIVVKDETEVTRYAAWKDGKIVFFDDPVEKLVSRLEHWYNVDIEIADSSLMAYHFTATFSRESLDQVLKYLSISTPLNYKYVSLPPAVSGKEQYRKIVIY